MSTLKKMSITQRIFVLIVLAALLLAGAGFTYRWLLLSRQDVRSG